MLPGEALRSGARLASGAFRACLVSDLGWDNAVFKLAKGRFLALPQKLRLAALALDPSAPGLGRDLYLL